MIKQVFYNSSQFNTLKTTIHSQQKQCKLVLKENLAKLKILELFFKH